MVCVDTSSMISYLGGENGRDVDWVEQALADQAVVFSPVTVTELLSDPALRPSVRRVIGEVPVLELMSGYWERAGLLRAKLLRRRRKARLADVLIAQSCLDHHVPLVTRDKDFHVYREIAKLTLLS